MSSQGVWWKNSMLLLMLLAVPLVIASIPRGDRPMVSQRSVDVQVAAPETAAPETAAPETAAPETVAPETVAPQQETASSPSESQPQPVAEPAPPAAAVAVVATPSPAADPAPNVSPEDLASDEGVEAWQRDVNERIRKAAMSEVLVSLADGHEKLDNRVIELEAIEKEVDQLRKRLDYLNELKAKWSGQQ